MGDIFAGEKDRVVDAAAADAVAASMTGTGTPIEKIFSSMSGASSA